VTHLLTNSQTSLMLLEASESYSELLITVILTLTGNDFMWNTVLQHHYQLHNTYFRQCSIINFNNFFEIFKYHIHCELLLAYKTRHS